MLYKLSTTSDWDFGIEPVSIILDDKQLTKRASKDQLKYAKTKGQTDLHIIAVGAYEGTGPNRNLDSWLEKDCISNNHYFKDSDRAVNRHHKNKPEDPKYGNIKAAAYNHPMKRIELVVGLDNDKCADILHEQETKGNSNWSMAARIASDSCSWCGHKAKGDDSRCDCTKNHLGEINKQGEVCAMVNTPDPRWFEISYVHRPADRIGMSLKKLASSGKLKPASLKDYLELYPGFTPPKEDTLISKKATDKRYILDKLAEIEKHIEAEGSNTGHKLFHARKLKHTTRMDDVTLDELRKHDPKKVLKILADHGIVFSPDDFCNYIFGSKVKDENVKGMKSHLPGIFNKLEETKETGEVANNERFEPASLDIIPKEIRKLIEGLTEGHSLSSGPAVRRMMRITIVMGPKATEKDKPQEQTKEAFDRELAKQYVAYKLAALNYMNEKGTLDEDVMINSIAQQL